jgi:hypothetical protein
VIKGFNVPIRTSAKHELLKFQGAVGNRGNFNSQAMNPYGRNPTAGPFASTPGQLAGQSFIGGGIPGRPDFGQDMRQSFAFNQGGMMQSGFGDRMNGVSLNTQMPRNPHT